MEINPFSPPNDPLGPEERQLANRKFLHDREETPDGLAELAALAYQGQRLENPRLCVNLAGIELDNPLMVAAGWDKFGEAVRGLHAIGFSSVEVGTVPEHAQPGNPKPRHFILGDGVTLNRYGFNSPGAAVVHQNLQRYRDSGIPLGLNVGRNKDVSPDDAPENHANAVRTLFHAAAYFALGVSSPNTVGVRDQQAKQTLSKIVEAVQQVMTEFSSPKPVFIKIAPDLTEPQIADVVEVALGAGIAGIIAVNSSPSEELKAKYGEQWRDQPGGLSGDDAEYRFQATAAIRFIYQQTRGGIAVIGAGGVKDTATALEKIMAGAQAIQILTALNFEGPELPGKINTGLVSFMDKQGVRNIKELVGAGSK